MLTFQVTVHPGQVNSWASLGIPDDLDVLAIIPFGYPPQARPRGKKQRKPLSEVAHRGRFGQPFT